MEIEIRSCLRMAEGLTPMSIAFGLSMKYRTLMSIAFSLSMKYRTLAFCLQILPSTCQRSGYRFAREDRDQG